MSIIFSKKYSGKIKRMISEGQICPSSLPEMYIKKTKKTEIDETKVEGLFPSKIFNILFKKTSTEITSNTLAIKITDKVFNGEAYYSRLNSLPSSEELKLLPEKYVIDSGIVYINTNEKYLQLGNKLFTVLPVIGLDLWNRDRRVSIRRLKDRFKITIKSNNELSIDLVSPSLLRPDIYNNWVSFYDCVHSFGTKSPIYLYTHSFEYFDKVEIHEKTLKINLRDLPIGDIHVEDIGEYLKVSYKTFRSNMQLNNEIGDNLFIYIDATNNVAQIKTRLYNEDNQYLIKIINHKTKLDTVEINSYILTPKYLSKPEVFYFTWETTTKYTTSMNTPIGCERVVLDLEKLIYRFIPTYDTSSYTIYENNTEISNLTLNTSDYEGKSNLNHIKSILDNSLI